MGVGDFEVKLVDLLLTVAIALLGWVLSEQRGMKNELVKLRILLTGETGESGIKGAVGDHTHHLVEHDKDLASQGERIKAVERDVRDLKEAVT